MKNNRDLYEELLKFKDTSLLAKSRDDFFDLACNISYIFQEATENDIKTAIPYGQQGIYDIILWNLFKNDYFNECLFKILKDQEKENSIFNSWCAKKHREISSSDLSGDKFQEFRETLLAEIRSRKSKLKENLRNSNVECKEVVHLTLHVSFLLISLLREKLNDSNIKYILSRLNILIGGIQSFQNYQFDRLNLIYNLNQISFDKKFDYNKAYPEELSGKIDDKFLFQSLKNSRNLIGLSLIILSQRITFSKAFKKLAFAKKDESYKDIKKEVLSTANKINFINSSLREYSNKDLDTNFFSAKDFIKMATSSTDQNILFILNKMVLPYKKTKNKKFTDGVLGMIENSPSLLEEVSVYFKNNFSVFEEGEDNKGDWSNKLFIATIRILSVLREISYSEDSGWKIKVFLNEYATWIEDVNQILNKYNLDDDWADLKRFLIQENTMVEWKSTFYTATQDYFVDEKTEKSLSKKMIINVVKPILGMMNVNGGTILVGVVENPGAIVRSDIKKKIIKKEEFSLFDVKYELEKKKKDIDVVKRDIQDTLFKMTGYTAEKFNGLWEIETLEVSNGLKSSTIVKINVNKSNNLIYGKEIINGKDFFSLTKRADGRTINVDISEYLVKENNSG